MSESKVKLRVIIQELEVLAPAALQESYDNARLLTGHPEMMISSALTTLDCTEAVIDEAINKGCNLVVAHHPIVFSGMKSLTGKNYVERTIIKAIKHDIAIYAIHTNLDNVWNGVNRKICDQLGLNNIQVLAPKQGLLRKLQTFVPVAAAEKVRTALFQAGAGHIGEYDQCSFNVEGMGTFRGSENSNPFSGDPGISHREQEVRVETIYPAYLEAKIINVLKKEHPYEEVAYDLVNIENTHDQIGSGMIGTLKSPQSEQDFLSYVKGRMDTPVIRHTPLLGKEVKRIAVCGGAGSFLRFRAMAIGADVFITGDFKYHEFFDAEEKMVIMDIGHFESEQFTSELLADFLRQKFPTFAVLLSGVQTNPVNYFTG